MRLCECGKPHRARGMCHACYERWRRQNPLDVLNKAGKWFNQDGSRKTCLYPDCEKDVFAQGLCEPHLQMFYYAERKNKGFGDATRKPPEKPGAS